MSVRSVEFYENLQSIFSKLSTLIESFSKTTCGGTNTFEQAIKAAFVKAYEFNTQAIDIDDKNIYFVLSTLRGICEDYIVLKFIFDKLNADKDEIVILKLSEELFKSALVQWKFFEKNHPNQFLYYQSDFQDKANDCRSKLRSLITKNGINCKDSLPTVRDMAKHSDLLELYEYLYHATSSLVHFNPRILLRMGWGNLPDIQFSTKNFNDYYKDFAHFYGTFLFSTFGKWLLNINLLDSSAKTELQKFDDLLNAEDRWPELVTFEEMNIGALSKHLFYKSPSSKK